MASTDAEHWSHGSCDCKEGIRGHARRRQGDESDFKEGRETYSSSSSSSSSGSSWNSSSVSCFLLRVDIAVLTWIRVQLMDWYGGEAQDVVVMKEGEGGEVRSSGLGEQARARNPFGSSE